MTPQKIFNTVARHLFAQGHKAIAKTKGLTATNSACVYRAYNGDKCAFGVLIRDDKYTPAMEGQGAYVVIMRYLPEFEPHERLISSLQSIHDDHKSFTFNRDVLKRELRKVAEAYNISPKVLDKLHP